MARDELIDGHVAAAQCKKAVDALTKHALAVAKKREETELLPGREENLWLVLTVKKVFPEKKLKPFKIPLAHPLVDPRTTPICLITKDPQREYKDLLETHGIKFISRVVGITKLKGKFKPYEARRMLLKENGLFLADERVVPLLPGLLGKKFFEAKKQPIPVCLTRKDLKGELERAVSSTYMHQNQGTCTSIKIGTLSHTPAQLLANLRSALPAAVARIPGGGWANVQSVHVKTTSSTALPVWACALGAGEDARWGVPEDAAAKASEGAETAEGGWTGFGGDEAGESESESGEDEESAKVEIGKKRGAALEGEALSQKKKKAKKTAREDDDEGSDDEAPPPPSKSKATAKADKDNSASATKDKKAKRPSATNEAAPKPVPGPSSPPKVDAASASDAVKRDKKEKKDKKDKKSAPFADAPAPAPAPAASPAGILTAKAAKKDKTASLDPPAPASKTVSASPSASDKKDKKASKDKKGEKEAKGGKDAKEGDGKPSLSASALKEKRNAPGSSGMEKKKAKVLASGGKGGAKAKDAIVGRKATARL